MIDIHSHALFGCDDGSKNMEQSIEMLRVACEVGVTAVFLTPHYMDDGYQTDKEIIYDKIDILKDTLKEHAIPVELYNGEEVFIYPNLPDDIDEKIISLNNSRYVLIEFPLFESITYIQDVIYRLLSKGKVPIIAHPERYLMTKNNFSFIEDLVNQGVLIQINANSLSKRYGKDAQKMAIKLLKRGMVHFVASDAHSDSGYMLLAKSLEALEKIVGKEKLKEITSVNQEKVIRNEEILCEKHIVEKVPPFLVTLFKGRSDN